MVDDGDITGTTLAGRYRIERKLAAGGMGAVYVAVQEPLGREVALKVLKPSLVGDPVAVDRFKREAKLVAQVGHPHIISIYEFGTADDGTLFIAMELLPGSPLGTILRERGPMPWQRTVNIVCSIARALGAAHERGVVHRDLKPDNILIVDAHGMADFVKVLDFGIAKLVREEEHAPALTGEGFVPGTPGYIAPEQIMGGATDDPRSDLYSLGVTWFEMLTGKRPYDGDSAMKIFMAHVQNPIPKLADRAPGIVVPPAIDQLLASLLAKDPALRPASAEAFIAAVEALGLQVPPTPAQSSPMPPIGVGFGSGLGTEVSAQLPTMTSLSTPGTSVRPFADAARPSPATPATATSAQPALAPSTAKAATVEQATIAKLLKERRFWIRFWTVAATLLVVTIVALIFVGRHFATRDMDDRSRRRAHLPVAAGDVTPADRAISDAVQAFVDGDDVRASRLARDAAEQFPDEPTPRLIEAAVLDPHRAQDRRKLLDEAAALAQKLADRRGPAAEGIEALPVLAKAYDSRVGREAFAAEVETCGACKQSVVVLAVAGDAVAVGRSEAALRFADNIIKIEPTSGLGYAKKSQFYLGGARASQAVAIAEEGLAHAPHSPAMLLAAARAHLAIGKLQEAVEELKRAGEAGGIAGELERADADLLLGDEKHRASIIEDLQGRGSGNVSCAIAVHHGPALIGALRAQDSVKLLADCLKARDADPAIVLSVLQTYAQAAEGAGDLALWSAVLEQKALYPSVVEKLEPPAVGVVIRGVVDDLRGEDASKDLAELKQHPASDVDFWPPNAARYITAILESRVEMTLIKKDPANAEQHTKNALAASEILEHTCRAASRAADINIAAGRLDEARKAIAQILEMKTYCLHATHEGVYVAKALIERAELDDKDPAAAADQLRVEMRSLFPTAADDNVLVAREKSFIAAHGR